MSSKMEIFDTFFPPNYDKPSFVSFGRFSFRIEICRMHVWHSACLDYSDTAIQSTTTASAKFAIARIMCKLLLASDGSAVLNFF